jgi:iron(III) transport system substrate-binding protein
MKSRRSLRLASTLTVVASAVAALVAATVAGAAPAAKVKIPPNPLKGVLKQVAGLKIAAREAKLHQLALKEGGTVTVYTSLSKSIYPDVQKAWAQTYPDIKLSIYRASSEDVFAKAVNEANAGTHGADIVETNGPEMYFLQHAKNVLVPYRGSPFASALPKAYRFDSFTADRVDTFVVAWNTNLVKNPPKTIKDLADPKWKGQLGLEPTDVDWYAALFDYFTTQAKPKMSAAAATAMFKKIGANSQIINGHTTLANDLAAGQISVVVDGHSQSIEALKMKGAPVELAPVVTPVLQRPQGMGITYTTVHPAAALLWYDWMLSKDGQSVLRKAGAEGSNPYYRDPVFAHVGVIPEDMRPIVTHYQEWTKKNQQITGVSG